MKLFLSILLAMTLLNVDAQEALAFDEPNYNFGEINEVDGPVDHTFVFTNNSIDSIRILSVRASCGCTTPAWTKDIVAPGGSGSITARYNPRNRPGSFRKSLTVSTSNPSIRKTLYINGTVKPRPRTVVDDLPSKVDGIRVKYMSMNFGKISTEKAVIRKFEIYNDTDTLLSLLADKSKMPDFIKVSLSPEQLKPKQRGNLVVSYDPTSAAELGFQSTGIELVTSETEKPKTFNVLATIQEYFPPLSEEELEQAPRLSFNRTNFDFGKLQKDAVAETTFLLTNTGKSPLNLRKITTNCGCTVAEMEKMDLAPGESSSMKVKFDTARRKGRQYKSITVFSNDPTAPTQVVTIRAEVPRT